MMDLGSGYKPLKISLNRVSIPGKLEQAAKDYNSAMVYCANLKGDKNFALCLTIIVVIFTLVWLAVGTLVGFRFLEKEWPIILMICLEFSLFVLPCVLLGSLGYRTMKKFKKEQTQKQKDAKDPFGKLASKFVAFAEEFNELIRQLEDTDIYVKEYDPDQIKRLRKIYDELTDVVKKEYQETNEAVLARLDKISSMMVCLESTFDD